MGAARGKLRAAVIGGGLGGSHGYAYERAVEYDLVAVCDINPQVFDRFFERAQIERGRLRQYSDYHEMIAAEDLDVISVATPDHLHADPVCAAAEAGVKGILCEKPLATTLADADRMVDTLARTGAKMSVDHTRSWVPSYQGVRQALRAGELGGLTRIIAHMGGKRSMLFRNGTHLIDGVCYFADAEPLWVIAAHQQGFEEYGPVYDGKGGKEPQFDPASTLIVEFANGVRALINSAKLTPQLYEFDLQGPGGRIVLNDTQCAAWKCEQPEGRAEAVEPPPGRGYGDIGENLVLAVGELAQMVWDDGPSSSPALRGRHTLEILLAALQSQVAGSAKISLPLPRD